MERKQEAVSESIGYLIIFGLVLTGIGLITLYGYPLLIQQQSSANVRNMEQTMIVLQNDIKSLTYKLANFKETSMRVSGGSLSLYGPVYTLQKFDIWTDDGGLGTAANPYHLIPGELRYFSTNDNLIITLENGAVIEKPLSTNGSFMLADPRWYLDSSTSTLVVNLMNLSSAPGTTQLLSQTGVGTVRMRLLIANVTSHSTPPPGTTVNVKYTPDPKNATPEGYGFAWQNYFTSTNNFAGGMTCTGNPLRGEALTCSKTGIQNIIVKEYDIAIETL
ncbi:MAG TPA: hypothetical protein VMT31_05295 [Methanomicrobiales archaeon]|jgi:hypothetical protein|nr:hypothetical protein [Methanomicrobiales archaeon]